MKGKSKRSLDFPTIMRKFSKAAISQSPSPNRSVNNVEISSIEERVKNILGIINVVNRPASNMLFFVMYDIESNKVRHQVVKYLERNGCSRIQKSIFLADLPADKYHQIKNDLAEVQAAYDNNDSILLVPISTDYLRSAKIIGQNINIDLITHSKNVLFF